ncbi:MAG: FecR family protein [Cytophagales bacterium]
MLNYKNYEVQDFLKDHSFRRWTLEKTTTENSFWELWLDIYPEKMDVVAKAQIEILTQNDTKGEIGEIEIKLQVENFFLKIKNSKLEKGRILKLNANRWYAVAASTILLLGVAYIFSFRFQDGQKSFVALQDNDDKVVEMVTESNYVNKSKLVLLPDGSSLILKPKSTVNFPALFDKDKRELTLSGEAFFEIAKDKSKPFFIYTNKLTTRVVGTSFSIKALENDKEIKFVVKTGTVSISKRSGEKDIAKNDSETIAKGNQQVVYNINQDKIVQTDIDQIVTPDFAIQKQIFDFNETPLQAVFKALESSYGMVIDADSSTISNCHLTATLGDEPFEQKLNLICQAVDATYTHENDSIKVKTRKDCK